MKQRKTYYKILRHCLFTGMEDVVLVAARSSSEAVAKFYAQGEDYQVIAQGEDYQVIAQGEYYQVIEVEKL